MRKLIWVLVASLLLGLVVGCGSKQKESSNAFPEFYFEYDPNTDNMWITSRPRVSDPDSVSVEVYDDSDKLFKKLISDKPDKNGIFHIEWNNTGMRRGVNYWAKGTIMRNGKAFESPRAYLLSISVELK